MFSSYSVPMINFNPHEREARDEPKNPSVVVYPILIHTSVKLVTAASSTVTFTWEHFNPHEREARDSGPPCTCTGSLILIHTSVKLVTARISVSVAAGVKF